MTENANPAHDDDALDDGTVPLDADDWQHLWQRTFAHWGMTNLLDDTSQN